MKASDYYRHFRIYTHAEIHMRVEKFCRTASGKGWQKKPYEVTEEMLTDEQYSNRVQSVSFMNGFCGGKAMAEQGYTRAGYIPVKITLVNPDATEKHVEYYSFR